MNNYLLKLHPIIGSRYFYLIFLIEFLTVFNSTPIGICLIMILTPSVVEFFYYNVDTPFLWAPVNL